MNLETYRERRRAFERSGPAYRTVCFKCRQPQTGCYCESLTAFDPLMRFVILFHPVERKRTIATGRMSHLMLKNSLLIQGEDFSGRAEVDRLIADAPSVILYPGKNSTNLSELPAVSRRNLFDPQKPLNVFVIDGTWATARKMIRSRNLVSLPRISFELGRPSLFGRVRKQPAPGCFSTIEAIHHTIELLGDSRGFDVGSRAHDGLLKVFSAMVSRQLTFVSEHTEID